MDDQERSRMPLVVATTAAVVFSILSIVFLLKIRTSDNYLITTRDQLHRAESQLDLITSVRDSSSAYHDRLAEKQRQLAGVRAETDSIRSELEGQENEYTQTVAHYYAVIDTTRRLRKTESDIRQDIFAVKQTIRAIEDETQRVVLVDSLLLVAAEETKEGINKIRNRNQVLLNIKRDLESRLLTPLPFSEILFDTLLQTFEQIYLAGASNEVHLADLEASEDSGFDYDDVGLEPSGDFVKLYEKDVLAIVAAHIELRKRFNARLASQIELLRQKTNDVQADAELAGSRNRELETSISALRTDLIALKDKLANHENTFASAREQYEADRKNLNTTLLGYNGAYEEQLELFEVIGELQLALIRQKNQSVTSGTSVVYKPDSTTQTPVPLTPSPNSMVAK